MASITVKNISRLIELENKLLSDKDDLGSYFNNYLTQASYLTNYIQGDLAKRIAGAEEEIKTVTAHLQETLQILVKLIEKISTESAEQDKNQYRALTGKLDDLMALGIGALADNNSGAGVNGDMKAGGDLAGRDMYKYSGGGGGFTPSSSGYTSSNTGYNNESEQEKEKPSKEEKPKPSEEPKQEEKIDIKPPKEDDEEVVDAGENAKLDKLQEKPNARGSVIGALGMGALSRLGQNIANPASPGGGSIGNITLPPIREPEQPKYFEAKKPEVKPETSSKPKEKNIKPVDDGKKLDVDASKYNTDITKDVKDILNSENPSEEIGKGERASKVAAVGLGTVGAVGLGIAGYNYLNKDKKKNEKDNVINRKPIKMEEQSNFIDW